MAPQVTGEPGKQLPPAAIPASPQGWTAQTQLCLSSVWAWCLRTGKTPWTTSLCCRHSISEAGSVSSSDSRFCYPSAWSDQQYLVREGRQDARLLSCGVRLGGKGATPWQLQGKPSHPSFWRPPSDKMLCIGGKTTKLRHVEIWTTNPRHTMAIIIMVHTGAAEEGVAALEVVTSCLSQGKPTRTLILTTGL